MRPSSSASSADVKVAGTMRRTSSGRPSSTRRRSSVGRCWHLEQGNAASGWAAVRELPTQLPVANRRGRVVALPAAVTLALAAPSRGRTVVGAAPPQRPGPGRPRRAYHVRLLGRVVGNEVRQVITSDHLCSPGRKVEYLVREAFGVVGSVQKLVSERGLEALGGGLDKCDLTRGNGSCQALVVGNAWGMKPEGGTPGGPDAISPGVRFLARPRGLVAPVRGAG